MSSPTVLIMAAGTGGHIFPALSVARRLQSEGINVEWLGTPTGMENDVLSGTNIVLHQLPVRGLRGKRLISLLSAPIMLLTSLWAALKVMKQIKPCCVLGMGGYVAGPGGLAAWLSRRPLVLHEQNSVAGTTNRILVPFAQAVLQSFTGTFKPSKKLVSSGNPVRADIEALYSVQRSFCKDGKLHVLVIGGSLGAANLNTHVIEAVSRVKPELDIEVWHQTGRQKYQSAMDMCQRYKLSESDAYRLAPFIDDMAEAYQWADLIICRAGAGTLSELAVAGLPSVLVPYPYAIDDHQTANARHLSDAGAAVLIADHMLDSGQLAQLLQSFAADPARLQTMSVAARAAAHPDACARVARVCQEVCHVA
ncbi:undecaprenyldiphospho-muramoylpentapeptide beta-N-acetylglucosaminyltransferase [Pseudohongiella spirulinae]|uniref:UDP-N-acetylglucosamine--N-acetylmuramyl-(pentapeptide) pyrophosphoryl-undecaprenol N-acetylglucosamine transferase n=1 Tax=Pseudohongiella spirulinae TaxID=1249552 RepID=A0A0S2KG46_9GAMM|nr:undecaprenyldiphospho-muramoylpentapeptide beta-N-acetylglucosaminyltransferase [Pseudohongiella spirulinae]ALO46930.1 UDP-N-acetylglucosamine--N-acetylmuramyl-(pentapeptide) pyrophosphoryl-undecaprenol N-acetylglucosamine transferase [Pseudohongiella spirulinae]